MSWLNSINVSALQFHDCSIYGVYIKPLTDSYARAGMCCFVTKSFSEEEVIDFHYGMLVFKAVLDTLIVQGVYGEGLMSGTRKFFNVSAIPVTKQMFSTNGKPYTVRLVRARNVFSDYKRPFLVQLHELYLSAEQFEREAHFAI